LADRPDLKSGLAPSGKSGGYRHHREVMRAAPEGGLLRLYRKAVVIRRNLYVTF
jgi:hypothetical protein